METFAAQITIPYVSMIHEQYPQELVDELIQRMRENTAIEVFKQIWETGTPMVVDTHLETWEDPMEMCVKYKLHYRLTRVQTMNVVMADMPPLTFINHEGIQEWKCSFCGVINIMDATYCGEKHEHAIGCGHPRKNIR